VPLPDTQTDLHSQLDAIQHGAAIAPLTGRAFLRITGSDATRWLNGMVTNNVKDLAPGEGNYNFLLNAQGRIQADCMIYREPGDGEAAYLLESDKSQIQTIQQHLDKFIIMDDVELTRVMSEHNGLLLIGAGVTKLVDTFHVGAGAPLRMFEFPSVDSTTTVLLSPSFGTVPRFELFDPGHFEFPGAVEVSPEALEAHRILSATPRYGTDITAKDLPQETALNGGASPALHFSKGCYLGQEIVERIHSRGQVHRTFTRFTLTGQLPGTLPAPLTANAKPAGEITSAIAIDGQIHALGYLRREHAHATLTYEGGTAHPVS
jgi:folate-binding protein YgfZ